MNETNNTTIVRLPPSPTGKLHVGNLRTLVFNYIFAQKTGGTIIYRSEDTDKERSQLEHEEYIKEVFDWLGIQYNEFYRQSERIKVYQQAIQSLIDNGNAYVSEETPSQDAIKKAHEEGKTLRTSVIRFKNPGKKVTFSDAVLGEISVDTTDLGDFVIAKDMETPLYHLTVVVDDGLMGITHVIRGADHIANTPRQILIQEALGYSRPVYAHAPLVVGADGKKLSKRHGSTASLEYRDMGCLPDAFINFLALVGWNPGTEQEVFTRKDLIQQFSLEKIQKSPAVFNEEKLQWINKQHLARMTDEEFVDTLKPWLQAEDVLSPELFERMLPELRERITLMRDALTMKNEGDLLWAQQEILEYDADDLVWKKSTKEEAVRHLNHVQAMIDDYDKQWNHDALKDYIFPYADQEGRGDVLWPLRFALSGKKRSPDPFSLLSILGKELAQKRLQSAIQSLHADK